MRAAQRRAGYDNKNPRQNNDALVGFSWKAKAKLLIEYLAGSGLDVDIFFALWCDRKDGVQELMPPMQIRLKPWCL